MRPLLAACTLAASCAMMAQNPIVRDQYTADPTARVFDGRLYLYPSHDIPSPIDQLKEWFCMEDYHVFSSDNLTDWADHGVILTQNRIPWVKPDSYAMWAPDCVEKDGRYYFYYPAAPRGEERGFAVGVAIADSPVGPFMPMFRPIEGIRGIDPCVLIDDDGQCYIYWCGGGMWMARLKDNMMQLDSEPQAVEGLPTGFKEGPFAFKRDGRYYYTFPWVKDKTECLAYAMADSPMGPFEFKGIIMDESPTGCWTNHHSIVEFEGQWYLFYHHNDYSPAMDKRRSARIDSLTFNPDGTIKKVTPTLRGVGLSDARRRVQVDRYSSVSPKGVTVAFLDPANPFEGWKAAFKRRGAWLRYNAVDFGDRQVEEMTMHARSRKGASIEVSSADGQSIATADIPAGGDWLEVKAPVANAPLGVNDLVVTLASGSEAEIDWLGFDALPWEAGAASTGRYRNYFAELGHSEDEIDSRLHEVFDGVFRGPNKVYFEVGDSMAYISDIKNNDVRSEGMSYGMMIAVQMGDKDIFDRLWRWSQRYMQHKDGPRKGYFAWSCRTDGTPNALGAASDGELYYVTALIFASNRWGNDSGINYLAEARNILDQAMQKSGMDHAAPLINLDHRLITFTPDSWGTKYTDPSYHVPAFYEVWARWADDGRSAFWRDCASRSRQYLHIATHPVTGLTPDYANYDGSPRPGPMVIGDAFRFDSWRVPMNVALDYAWSGADADWQRQYADRVQSFFYSQGIDEYVDQYNIDGSPVSEIVGDNLRHSVGLVSALGAASLAATDCKSREFARRLWDSKHEPYADGYFDAYYDGLLRLFAFMHLSGRYRIIEPIN